MGLAATLVMCDLDHLLSFPLPKDAPHKFGFDWPSGFRGKDLRNCGRMTMEGRMTEHGHPIISSPCEPSVQVS